MKCVKNIQTNFVTHLQNPLCYFKKKWRNIGIKRLVRYAQVVCFIDFTAHPSIMASPLCWYLLQHNTPFSTFQFPHLFPSSSSLFFILYLWSFQRPRFPHSITLFFSNFIEKRVLTRTVSHEEGVDIQRCTNEERVLAKTLG